MFDLKEVNPGRRFIGNIRKGADLISALEKIGVQKDLRLATFTATGSVSKFTVGTFDQNQQVYVTHAEEKPLEIVGCTGNISWQTSRPFVHAHIILSDDVGIITGGRLFSDSIVYHAEIHLQEWVGLAPIRTYDERTGQMRWHLSWEK